MNRIPDSKREPAKPYIPMCLTEAEYWHRCRAVAAADALQSITEAISADRKAGDPSVSDHLTIAQDAVLDALSRIAEHSGAK